MRRSITLLETIVAVVLLGVLMLGFYSFNVASKTFFRSSDTKTKVVNDLTYILEHIHRHVAVATGDVTDPGILVPSNHRIRVRIDQNDPPTPADYSDDTWFEYFYDALAPHAGEFRFTNLATGAVRVLSDDVIAFNATMANPELNELEITELELVNDRVRWVADGNVADDRENPAANITDTGSGSVVRFSSYSHSIN